MHPREEPLTSSIRNRTVCKCPRTLDTEQRFSPGAMLWNDTSATARTSLWWGTCCCIGRRLGKVGRAGPDRGAERTTRTQVELLGEERRQGSGLRHGDKFANVPGQGSNGKARMIRAPRGSRVFPLRPGLWGKPPQGTVKSLVVQDRTWIGADLQAAAPAHTGGGPPRYPSVSAGD